MTIGWTIWLSLGVLNVVIWSARALALGIGLRRRLMLTSSSHPPLPTSAPRLSVLVAAKEEELNIERCISGLLTQDHPNFEIIAIDDRSRDATPRILERLARESNGKLTVVTITDLPPGWFGKNHAMHRGVQQAGGDWLLFTDADCRFTSPRALSMAMQEAMHSDSDFLCLTPVLEAPSTWERIIQPVCTMVLILWFLPYRVNDPRRPTAYANGAFMLLRRSCYDGIGGHEAVRGAMNEDLHMARAAKGRGFRLRVMENDDLYTTRMYSTLAELRRGWRRIFRGCLETVPRLATSMTLILTFTILPCVSLAVAAVGRLTGDVSQVRYWNIALALWGVSVVMLLVLTGIFYRMMRIPVRWAPTYVLGGLVVVGILARAIWDTVMSRDVRWRGTDYAKSAESHTTQP